MKNYYHILRISPNATHEGIKEAYKRRLIYTDIGNSDYENMWDSLEVKCAYDILSNKAVRFLYDIKSGIAKDERHPISFGNNEELDNFLSVIEDKLISLNDQNKRHIKEAWVLKNEVNKLSKSFKDEKEVTYQMEKTISDLLMKDDLCQSTIKRLNSLNEGNKIIYNNLHVKYEVIDMQNNKLRKRLRGYDKFVTKVMICVIMIMCFIFFLVSINFKINSTSI